MLRFELLPLLACLALSACAADRVDPAVGRVVIDTDRSVNCTSIEAMVADVIAGRKSDRDKAVAVFDFVTRMMWIPYVYDQPKEMVRGRLASVTDPVRNLVVYGAGGCGIQSVVFSTLLAEAGLEPRQINPGFAHVSNEVKWGGQWHWMDVWLPLYLTDDGGRIYSYAELMADRGLISRAVKAGQHSQNFMYNPRPDTRTMLRAKPWKPLGSGVRKAEYAEDLALRPGERVTWLWGNVGKWYWPGEKFSAPAFKFPADRQAKKALPHWEPYKMKIRGGPHPGGRHEYYRYHGNAVFETEPPLTKRGLADLNAALVNAAEDVAGLRAADPTRPATIEIPFVLPYVIADSEITGSARPAPGGAVTIAYSVDDGTTWRPATRISEDGPFALSVGKPNSPKFPAGTTSGQYAYRLRIALEPGKGVTALTGLKVVNTTMLNFYSRPHLETGRNQVTVSADNGGALALSPLRITWKWLEDWRTERAFSRTIERVPATFSITVGGSKRPRMKSITLARPARRAR